MKKAYQAVLIGCMLCFAILLTACGTTPPNTQNTHAATTTFSLSEEARMVTDIDGIMGKASAGTENGFYELKMRPDGGANITYIDYKTKTRIFLCNRVECTHKQKDCTSWLSPADVAGGAGLFTDQQYLYLLRLGTGAQAGSVEGITKDSASQILQMDLNGNNRKCLVEFSGATTLWGGIVKDENKFYFLQDTVVQENGTPTVKRNMVALDLHSAQMTSLCEFSLDTYFVGVTPSGFIMKQIVGSDTGAARQELSLYRTATGTIEPIQQWTQDNIISQVYQGEIYYLKPAKKELLAIDADTQKAKTVVENLPINSDDKIIRQGIFDGRFKFQVYQHGKSTVDDIKYFSIHLQTGELTENKLIYTAFHITSEVFILAETTTHFLVLNDKRLITFDVTAPDGTVSKMEGDEPVYSLIAKTDFWSNHANYIPITDHGVR